MGPARPSAFALPDLLSPSWLLRPEAGKITQGLASCKLDMMTAAVQRCSGSTSTQRHASSTQSCRVLDADVLQRSKIQRVKQAGCLPKADAHLQELAAVLAPLHPAARDQGGWFKLPEASACKACQQAQLSFNLHMVWLK